jgi:sirohydrochlorin ferrochelatase
MNTDLDIILAAHGAGDGSGANMLVQSCARRLEAGGSGAHVTAAFQLGTPKYADALHAADRANVLVVPLLLSDGYFADHIRREIDRRPADRHTPVMLRPLGTQRRFIQSVVDRVAEAIGARARSSRRAGVIVVAHGTTRHAGSGTAGREIADAIEQRCALSAHVAYLDQSPTIEEVLASAALDAELLIVPLFLGNGAHAERDVPSRVAAAAAARGVSGDQISFVDLLHGVSSLTDIIDGLVREARE